MVACFLLLVFFVVKFFIDRSEEGKYEDWRENTKQHSLYVNVPVLVIGVAAVVEALIILFATQTFTGNMIFVDSYTILLSLVFFVMLITPVVIAMRKNQRELQMYQQMQYQQHLLQQQQMQQGQGQAAQQYPTF